MLDKCRVTKRFLSRFSLLLNSLKRIIYIICIIKQNVSVLLFYVTLLLSRANYYIMNFATNH